MKSKVYFIGAADHDTKDNIIAKFNHLLDKSNILDIVSENDEVAVKMHFGEEGNTGFVKPAYVRCVCDALTKKGSKVVVSDTNTLYRGKRLNAKDHLMLAHEHGFTEEAIGAPVVIAEGNESVNMQGRFIKNAMIAPLFLKPNCIIGISHFKGHVMTGFGGSLKNIGMGCASREGKLAQHSSVSPFVRFKNCIGCGECKKICPVGAIDINTPLTPSSFASLRTSFSPMGREGVRQRTEPPKAQIDSSKCIGCASCIAACPSSAIDIHWESGAGDIQEKMIEYARAVLETKKEKSAFVNFAIKITKECDCLAKDDPRIAPDIGIFESVDPVSVDKASFDAVKSACGKDIFKEAWPERDWSKQLNYAQKIGLGNLNYELITLGT